AGVHVGAHGQGCRAACSGRSEVSCFVIPAKVGNRRFEEGAPCAPFAFVQQGASLRAVRGAGPRGGGPRLRARTSLEGCPGAARSTTRHGVCPLVADKLQTRTISRVRRYARLDTHRCAALS